MSEAPAATRTGARTARLYRMVMPGHLCPYGLKARYLLQRHGFEVDDRHLRSRAETEAFKREHGVETTPQTFIDGVRIGGYDELRRHLDGRVVDPDAPTYRPVIAIFGLAAAMAAAITFDLDRAADAMRLLERFIALAMCLLALQKLRDVESFSTMFLNYDLLARRYVPYAYVYPYAEALAGVLMLGALLPWLSAPIAIVIGAIGAASVLKAVYIDRRELKCACVGGDSKTPLGAVSLTENVMMLAMGLWTAVRALTGV